MTPDVYQCGGDVSNAQEGIVPLVVHPLVPLPLPMHGQLLPLLIRHLESLVSFWALTDCN